MFEQTIAELTHANPEMRYEAARKLGESKDAQVVQPLISVLTDNNTKVQYAAFSALIKIGSADAAAPLTDMLVANPDSRVWALLTLNIGLRLRMGLLELVTRGDMSLAERLNAALDSQAFNELQRAFLVRLLGRTGDTSRVEPLIDILISDTQVMQAAAAEALGWIGESRAVSPLLTFLSEGEPSDALREVAAEALGRIGESHAVQPLIAALEDSNEWVRRAAAEALGELCHRDAIEPLSNMLNDESTMVQETAFEALKKLSANRHSLEQ